MLNKINKKYALLSFLILAQAININSMSYVKSAYDSISSKVGWKTTATLTLLTGYIYKKYNNAKKQNQLKLEEAKYVSENIEITKDTIFVFDINDVIIDADFTKIWNIINTQVLTNHKMQLASALCRPYLYYLVLTKVFKGAVPEEILTKIQETYPQYTKLCGHGLELANAQKEVPGMFKVIQALKNNGHNLLLMSNVGQDKISKDFDNSIDMLKKQFPVFNVFDLEASHLTSKEDNYTKKPNPNYYAKFLEKFEKKFGKEKIKDIVFVDDRMKNIVGARNCGIKSVWFLSTEDFVKKLKLKEKPYSIRFGKHDGKVWWNQYFEDQKKHEEREQEKLRQRERELEECISPE